MPGVGGSLGACAVCGDTFLKEIILNETVPLFSISGIERDLPAHKKCVDAIKSLHGTWAEIRDRFPVGPLHDAFDEQAKESGDGL
jgi:hypothetical protein